jgi:hypothetical protein
MACCCIYLLLLVLPALPHPLVLLLSIKVQALRHPAEFNHACEHKAALGHKIGCAVMKRASLLGMYAKTSITF